MSLPRSRPFLPILFIVLTTCVPIAGDEVDESFHAIEINGTVCGYSHTTTSPAVLDGRPTTLTEQRIFMMISALGSEFNSEMKFEFHVDRDTRRLLSHRGTIHQGRQEFAWVVQVDGNRVRLESDLWGGEKTLEVTPDVVLPTPQLDHVIADFVEGDLETSTYRVLAYQDAEVQRTTFTRLGTETVELGGRTYETVVLAELNETTGVKMKWWIDRDSHELIRADLPSDRAIYLADSSIVKQIELANVDPQIMARTNVSIGDVLGIRYMKVRAKLEPSGLWVTPERLNVPGQRFTGTVKDNLIEGVFEIEHPLYDGAGAPAFPPDLGGDDALRTFLEPGPLIESDAAEVRAMALRITEGAADSWEASRRLARWVADNIDYAIPGGGTALKTLQSRAGECGSHSNLYAALCRSVGIPARVVWGCMYTPNFGGSFGQHGWNEVYMGAGAGWVPVDTTANEADYVDSGHVRVGVHESLSTAVNLVEMEILDYRVGTGEPVAVEPGKYDRYLGRYTNPDTGTTVEVRVQSGSLAVDIPNSGLLALEDPDEDGVRYLKLSNRVYVRFEDAATGEVPSMEIHELVRMQRISSPEEIGEDVPERFRPYLGVYLLAQLNAEFTVIWGGDSLAVEDPLNKMTVGLQPPDDQGRWLDEFGKNTIHFELDDDGSVRALVVDSRARLHRNK